MPHLHLSSLVTKKKIETIVIFFHSTSRLCTYPYLAHLLYIIKCVPHCPVHTPPSAPPPTVHLSIPPQHPIRRTSRQQERTPRQERQARQQNTPRRLPNIHHLRPTIRRHHTKRRGAIYDARRPAGRNHRRTQHARDGSPNIPRQPVRPTSCRPRAATGVINGAPTTHRHQDNPAGRNHRRTQHARGGPPSIHPPRRHHAKRRGAIYDARRPAGRNRRRMTTRPRRPAQHPPPAANHPSPPHQT